MIDATNTWQVIEATYSKLQDAQGLSEEQAADPNAIDDYDLEDAIDQTTYEIAGAHFPEIAMLEAFARNGYLDNDRIWDEIGEAIRRGLEAYADEIWQEYQANVIEDDEDEDDEDWNE